LGRKYDRNFAESEFMPFHLGTCPRQIMTMYFNK
jgi:hypothetical protein